MNTKTSAWVIVVLVLYGLVDISSSLNIGYIKSKISNIENSYPYVIVANEKHEAKTKTEPKIETDPVRVELTAMLEDLKKMRNDVLKHNDTDLAFKWEDLQSNISLELRDDELCSIWKLMMAREDKKEIEATLKKGEKIK